MALSAIGALAVFLWSPVATAATGAFEMGVEASQSAAMVRVRFLQPATSVGQFEASGVLDELVGVLPASQVGANGRPLRGTDPVLVSLVRVESGVLYEGSVELSEGEWAFFPWPTSEFFDPEENPGAPPTQYVRVGATSPWTWAEVAAAIVVFAGVVALLTRRRAIVPV